MMPKTWWPVQAAFIFWLIAAFVIAWAAKAEPAISDDDLLKMYTKSAAPAPDIANPRQVLTSEQRIGDLEKRIEDLEINLAAQIAKPCVCNAPPAADSVLDKCLAKTKRFIGTQATDEQKERFIGHCVLQYQIWERRDP